MKYTLATPLVNYILHNLIYRWIFQIQLTNMAHDTWTRTILYNLSYVITERKKERLGMIFNIMYINEYDKKGCQSYLFQSSLQRVSNN